VEKYYVNWLKVL